MKILLTGKNGQVGWELQRTLATLGEIISVDRNQLDLANPDSIRAAIREIKPNLIVNAAAYTAVDKAESEPELAMAVNGTAPGVMAEEAKCLGAGIIHYSTDYVFDGEKKGPYNEGDVTNPRNVYGRTKLAGEEAVQAAGVPFLILRTSWVYGVRGKNFLLTMLRLAKERDEIKVVDDQIGAPTWSRMIAEATAQILAQGLTPDNKMLSPFANASGVYHLASADHTSWYGFANEILKEAQNHGLDREPNVLPIPTTDYPLPAVRPMNSLLDCGKLKANFGLQLPDWHASLRLCVDELLEKTA